MKPSHIHSSAYLIKQAGFMKGVMKGVNSVRGWLPGATKAAPAVKGLGSFPNYSAMRTVRKSTPAFLQWGIPKSEMGTTNAMFKSNTPYPLNARSQIARKSVPNSEGTGFRSGMPRRVEVPTAGTEAALERGPALTFASPKHLTDTPTWRHELTHMYHKLAPANAWQGWTMNFGHNGPTRGLRLLGAELGARAGQFKGWTPAVKDMIKVAPIYAGFESSALHKLPFQAMAHPGLTAGAVGAGLGGLGVGTAAAAHMLKPSTTALPVAPAPNAPPVPKVSPASPIPPTMKTSHTTPWGVKSAAPAWAKAFKLLSPATKAKLTVPGALPNKIRSVSKIPLGKGAEGSVYPSFSPPLGDTATKVFNRPIGAGVDKKVELMKQRPDIFPQIHDQHPKGYTMERLEPIVGRGSSTNPNVWDKQVRDNVQEVRRLSSSTDPSDATQLPGAQNWLRETWQGRRDARGLQSLKQNIKGPPVAGQPAALSSFTLKDNAGTRYGMRDYAPGGQGEEWHNIMRGKNNRMVVSDPIFDPITSGGRPNYRPGNVTPVVMRPPPFAPVDRAGNPIYQSAVPQPPPAPAPTSPSIAKGIGAAIVGGTMAAPALGTSTAPQPVPPPNAPPVPKVSPASPILPTMKTSHIHVSQHILKQAGLGKALKGLGALVSKTPARKAMAVPNIAPSAAELAKTDTSLRGILKADIAQNLGTPKPKIDAAKVQRELAALQPHRDGAIDLSGVTPLPPLVKPKPIPAPPPTAWGQSKLPDTIARPKEVSRIRGKDYFEDMRLRPLRPDYEAPALNSVWYGRHPRAAPEYLPIKKASHIHVSTYLLQVKQANGALRRILALLSNPAKRPAVSKQLAAYTTRNPGGLLSAPGVTRAASPQLLNMQQRFGSPHMTQALKGTKIKQPDDWDWAQHPPTVQQRVLNNTWQMKAPATLHESAGWGHGPWQGYSTWDNLGLRGAKISPEAMAIHSARPQLSLPFNNFVEGASIFQPTGIANKLPGLTQALPMFKHHPVLNKFLPKPPTVAPPLAAPSRR